MASVEWENKKICVLIPAYNAGRTIARVIDKLQALAFTKTILVINDGSLDDTRKVAQRTGVTVISHSKNSGKGAALRTGFDHCKYLADIVVTVDADDQHEVSRIPDLLQSLVQKKLALVIGTRSMDLKIMPWPRVLSNFFSSLIVSCFCGQKISDSQSGFRAIEIRMLQKVQLKTNHFDTETELLLKTAHLGFKIGACPIPTVYFDQGSTAIRPLTDLMRFIFLILKTIFRR